MNASLKTDAQPLSVYRVSLSTANEARARLHVSGLVERDIVVLEREADALVGERSGPLEGGSINAGVQSRRATSEGNTGSRQARTSTMQSTERIEAKPRNEELREQAARDGSRWNPTGAAKAGKRLDRGHVVHCSCARHERRAKSGRPRSRPQGRVTLQSRVGTACVFAARRIDRRPLR